jgi:hypothetical protein
VADSVRLGLCTLARNSLRAEAVERHRERLAGRDGFSSDALRALENAVAPDPAGPAGELAVPAGADPSELSRWALAAQARGAQDQAIALHERAARACLDRGPDRWSVWVALRGARTLQGLRREREAGNVARTWTAIAEKYGWAREECACLEILSELDAAAAPGAALRERLRGDPACRLEYLRRVFADARAVYRAGNLPAAQSAMAEYVDGMEPLQAELNAAGLRTYVEPRSMAEAFAVVVDCWGRQTATLDKAVTWAERSKLWNLRGDDWRPLVAPVAATWAYPFVPIRSPGGPT